MVTEPLPVCSSTSEANLKDGDVAVFDSPVRQGIFLPESTFSADSLTCVRPLPCAIACIDFCAHVKDPVVRVRVRWIMETVKHPARTVGWVVRLCRSWLSPGSATRISHGRNPIGTIHTVVILSDLTFSQLSLEQLTFSNNLFLNEKQLPMLFDGIANVRANPRLDVQAVVSPHKIMSNRTSDFGSQ